MEYGERAISAIQAAERSLLAQLRAIIQEAIDADDYAGAADVSWMAGVASHLLRQATSERQPTGSEQSVSRIDLPGYGQPARLPTPPRTDARGQQAAPRESARREHYPQFLRDGERLVKVAWSKKERSTYEHRAPRAVIDALIAAVQKKKGENKLFEARDVMPLKNAHYEDYPSYQSYLALNWLRHVGVIRKKGREGYILKANAASDEKLQKLWNSVPPTESNG